ncbi:MAG: NAD-glutamate dehydrogenase, partial [Alphaproteobacteria bacterium]|nr:NAD-glutamate dehydrogenase [Alphaproteobacteria bacterium]
LNDDRPFLLASILNVVIGEGRQIHQLVHPIVSQFRDKTGERCGKDADGAEEISESHIYLEIDRETDDDDLASLKDQIKDVLASIRLAVDDWQDMLAELKSARTALAEEPPEIDQEELEESLAFLDWLADDNFLFLGYREFTFDGKADHMDAYTNPEEGLGLLRDSDFAVLRDEDGLGPVSPEVREFLKRQDPLIILKGNVRSPVHRRAFVDVVGVKQFDGKGGLTGEKRFVGLFTSRAYHRRPQSIPLLRRKVQKVIEKSGFRERSHDARALVEVMQTFPRDELFQADVDEISETVLAILRLRERPRPRIFVRKDPYHRFVSMLVFIPREVYDTPLRHKVEALVCNAFNGEIESEFTQVGDQPLARL